MPCHRAAIALAAAIVIGGCSPPSPSPTSTSVPPSASKVPASSSSQSPDSSLEPVSPRPSLGLSSSPGPSVGALPPLGIQTTLPVTHVVALAPAANGAWYLASSGGAGTAGLLDARGVVRHAAVGPVPVAIAATDRALFVVEGVPDGTGDARPPRSGVLERLDPTTLKVRATAKLDELTTDVAIAGGLAWTIDAAGTVIAHDEETLAATWTLHLDGTGEGSLAAADDALWVATGKVSDSGVGAYVIARVELAGDHATSTASLPGDGVGPSIAAGTRVWLAAAVDPVYDWLYPIDTGLVAETPTYLPAPAGLEAGGGHLWWVSGDGSTGAIDEQTGARTPDLMLPGASGTSIAVSGPITYAAGGDAIYVLTPAWS